MSQAPVSIGFPFTVVRQCPRSPQAATAHPDDNLSVYGRIALEYGLRLHTMHREWAEWASGQIA